MKRKRQERVDDMEREQLLHLAKLSGLKLTDLEIEKFSSEMADIIDLMDTIQQVRITKQEEIRPALSFDEMPSVQQTEHAERDRLLSNAKDIENRFFTVPKVVKE